MPLKNASTKWRAVAAEPMDSTPIRQTLPCCCARAAIGHATAPPSSDIITARLAGLGVDPMSMTSAAFGKLIADETEKWGKVIRAANVKAD